MKIKPIVFLLSATILCCLLLILNGCHTQNKADIRKFNSYLKSQQETFIKQFKQVELQYPMVAFALIMQDATIAENANPLLTESVVSLTGSTNLSLESSVRLKICLDNLFRDLGRSQTYEEGLGAFKRYRDCRGRVNEVRSDDN